MTSQQSRFPDTCPCGDELTPERPVCPDCAYADLADDRGVSFDCQDANHSDCALPERCDCQCHKLQQNMDKQEATMGDSQFTKRESGTQDALLESSNANNWSS